MDINIQLRLTHDELLDAISNGVRSLHEYKLPSGCRYNDALELESDGSDWLITWGQKPEPKVEAKPESEKAQ